MTSDRRPRIVLAHWAGLGLIDDAHAERIREVGVLANRNPLADWDDPRATDLLADADVILGHWGCPRIDARVLERAPKLGLIAYVAGTVKTVVTDAVWDRPIRVTSGAAANAEPVAEFTLAAILLANKDVFWRRDLQRDPALQEQRQPSDVPVGNVDKTIGIVSASLVGRRVIELLGAFESLRVVLYDPFVTADEAERLGVRSVGLDELCAISDIVSVHAPALDATHHLIGADQLAAMRTGATLINTARASIVDQDALVAELAAGRLSAVLDVAEPEPLPPDHLLLRLPTAFVTPHLAGSQGTELDRMIDHAIDEIRRWVAGAPARNEITKGRLAFIA